MTPGPQPGSCGFESRRGCSRFGRIGDRPGCLLGEAGSTPSRALPRRSSADERRAPTAWPTGVRFLPARLRRKASGDPAGFVNPASRVRLPGDAPRGSRSGTTSAAPIARGSKPAACGRGAYGSPPPSDRRPGRLALSPAGEADPAADSPRSRGAGTSRGRSSARERSLVRREAAVERSSRCGSWWPWVTGTAGFGTGDRRFDSGRPDLRGRGAAVLASLMSSRPWVRIQPAHAFVRTLSSGELSGL